jgi:hypothetical protein
MAMLRRMKLNPKYVCHDLANPASNLIASKHTNSVNVLDLIPKKQKGV